MATTSPPLKRPRPSGKHQNPPMLKVTRYERVASFMITIVLGLVITVLASFVIWMTTWKPTPETVAIMESWDPKAGFEDGNEEDDFPDLDTPTEEIETEETFEAVMQNADQASEQAYELYEERLNSIGSPQRGTGSGRPLGVPGGTGTGLPRDQRWFMRFAGEDALEEYARQLDFFKIDMGVLFIGSDTITVFSNLSSPSPRKKTITATTMPKGSLPFTWQGGGRKEADIKLLQKAGIANAGSGIIFHFYPKETQQLLFKTEQSYRNKKTEEIRRTYFRVQRAGSGYEFKVTRQSYF